MKKANKICLALACLLTGLSFGGCKKSYTVPTFADTEGVQFTAYSGPTVENWASNGKNPNQLTDENYKKLAEAGFNKVLALYEGASKENTSGMDVYDAIKKRSEKAETDAMRALELAEKYGIKYYVRDWAFYGLVKNYVTVGIDEKEEFEKIIADMFSEDNPYIDHPAYGGNFGHDEPNKQEMEKIVWQVELYQKYVKQNGLVGGEPYINLNPCYVTGKGLSLDNDMTYADYVDWYFEHLAPLLGYVSWDFYPFVANNYDGSYIRNMYLYNFEIMAKKCKETGYELRTMIQSVGDWTGIRSMTSIGDYRLQIASAMAFGAKEIAYYSYCGGSEEGILNYNTGEYSWKYEAVKTANNEVHAMEDAYLHFDWDGVMYHNADELYDNQCFANITSPMESHKRIKSIEATEDTLVGVFKDDQGMDAFMIVNFTDPYFDKDSEVTVQFKDAKALLMYRLGQKVVVDLPKDGSYTFKMYPGEGRFVIPLK